MFGIHFRADLQLFTWPNIAESHMDANICNRGCKRLRPEIHTLICMGKCLLLTIFSGCDGHMEELFGAGFRI